MGVKLVLGLMLNYKGDSMMNKFSLKAIWRDWVTCSVKVKVKVVV